LKYSKFFYDVSFSKRCSSHEGAEPAAVVHSNHSSLTQQQRYVLTETVINVDRYQCALVNFPNSAPPGSTIVVRSTLPRILVVIQSCGFTSLLPQSEIFL
jgi:hypothetical protein